MLVSQLTEDDVKLRLRFRHAGWLGTIIKVSRDQGTAIEFQIIDGTSNGLSQIELRPYDEVYPYPVGCSSRDKPSKKEVQ